MNEIIRTSGLSAGAVYRYFQNKEDLILAALTTFLSELRNELEKALEGASRRPPDESLGEILAGVARISAREDFDFKNIALLGWSEAQRNARLRATIGPFYVTFRNELAGLVKDWQRHGDACAHHGVRRAVGHRWRSRS